MNHKVFLEKFPNAKEAAAEFNVSVNAIAHWKMPERGIPSRYWPQAEIVAAQRGWPVTALSLSLARPQSGAAK